MLQIYFLSFTCITTVIVYEALSAAKTWVTYTTLCLHASCVDTGGRLKLLLISFSGCVDTVQAWPITAPRRSRDKHTNRASYSSLQRYYGSVEKVWTHWGVSPVWAGNSTPTVEPLDGYKPLLQTGCLMLLTGQWRLGFGPPLGSVFSFIGEEPLGRINNGFSSVPFYRSMTTTLVLVHLLLFRCAFFDPL